MKKRKSAKIKSSGISSFLIGIVINAAAYVAFVAVFSIAAYFSSDPTGKIRIFSLAALLLSGAVGGFTVGKRSEGAYTAILSAAAFSILALLVGIIISGTAPGIGNVINYILYIIISALCSKLATRKGGRSKRR